MAFTWALCHHKAEAQIHFLDPVPQPWGINVQDDTSDIGFRSYLFTDIDADGDLDVFYREEAYDCLFGYDTCHCLYQEQVSLLEFDDPEMLDCPSANVFDLDGYFQKLVDLDGDGDLDVLHLGTYYYGYWGSRSFMTFKENVSDTYFPGELESRGQIDIPFSDSQYSFIFGRSWQFADIDQDGLPDLIISEDFYNYYDSPPRTTRTYVFKNNGDGTIFPFSEEVEIAFNPGSLNAHYKDLAELGYIIKRFQFGDLDNDGDLDLLLYACQPTDGFNACNSLRLFYAINEPEDLFNSVGLQTAVDLDLQHFPEQWLNFYVLAHFFQEVDIDHDGDLDIVYNDFATGYYSGGDSYSYINTLYFVENRTVISGISEHASVLPLQLFPNPATQQVHIETAGSGLKNQIQITDLSGRTVFETYTTEQIHQLDVSVFASGTYVIRVESPEGVRLGKLVISE